MLSQEDAHNFLVEDLQTTLGRYRSCVAAPRVYDHKSVILEIDFGEMNIFSLSNLITLG